MRLKNPADVIAKLVAAGLLFAALAHHPYGYYTLLRWVVCGVSVFAAVRAAEFNRSGWAWTLAIAGLVFNPIFPVYLRRENWAFIDIGVALVLLISIVFIDLRPPPL
jgi:hypothetical protein